MGAAFRQRRRQQQAHVIDTNTKQQQAPCLFKGGILITKWVFYWGSNFPYVKQLENVNTKKKLECPKITLHIENPLSE